MHRETVCGQKKEELARRVNLFGGYTVPFFVTEAELARSVQRTAS